VTRAAGHPGVLCDWVAEERQHGIEAGQVLGDLMAETWVFTDLGISKGMEYGIKRAEEKGRLIRRIQLGPNGETRLKTFV